MLSNIAKAENICKKLNYVPYNRRRGEATCNKL
jgi:hypothetical protein